MPLHKALDKFLASSFSTRPHFPNPPRRMEWEGSSSSNPPPPVLASSVRELEDRVRHLEGLIPRLTEEIRSLRRQLRHMETERDRLQAEITRLRGCE